MKNKKFIFVKANGYDLTLHVDTIKYVERNPNDRENSVWVWTDWAHDGYVVVDENINVFNRRLGI